MRIICRLLVVAAFLVSLSMSAQDWSSSGGVRWTSDRAGIGGAPASTPQLHVFGPVWVAASHLKVEGAGGADLIADAPLGAVSQVLLRSDGVDAVALRREPNTGDFTIRVAGGDLMRFRSHGTIRVGAAAPGATWFDIVGGPVNSQLYTASDGVSGGISHSSLAADSNWLGFDVLRNSTVWYMRHASAAWIAKTGGKLAIKASTGNAVGAISQPIRDLLTIDLTTGTVGVGTTTPASSFDIIAGTDLSQFYTAGDGVSPGAISHTSLGADSDWLGFDVVRNSSLWYVRHPSAAWIAKTDGKLAIKASTGNAVGAIGQPIRDLLTIDLTTGNAHFSGIVTGTEIRATFEDVAEWVPATGNVSAGSVVIVDVDATNGVTASSTPYDTRVAGVVSPQPGVILGKPGPSKVMVATTGRVRVKVDATRGPIRAGDLLVTSDKPGMAMKSEPVSVGGFEMHRPGTLVGKALESIESGVGEILVLLSLQ